MVDCPTVRGWENGAAPLFIVPHVQLYDLAHAVSSSEVQATALLKELVLAGQCDLLVADMLDGSADYAELPPIGEDNPSGQIARDLLSWAFRGTVPSRYRQVSRPGCLYACPDRYRMAEIVDDLRLSERGSDLAGYAGALSVLLGTAGQSPAGRSGPVRFRLPRPALSRTALRRAGRLARWWFRRVAR